jgi:hypothetical protein
MKKSPISAPKAKSTATRLNYSHEEISSKAEALWRQQGCPEGRDDEIWLAAERVLVNRIPTFNGTGVNDELDALFPNEDRSEPTAL